MMLRKKLWLFTISLVMVCVLLFTGCTAPTTTPEKATKTETSAIIRTDLNFALISDPVSLWPGGENEQMTVIMNNQLYNQLVTKKDDGTFEGELAKNWEISEDGLTYTFHLRDDVYFHNGKKMTAEDVAWTMNYWHKYEKYTKDYLVFFDRVEVVDEYTVVFHYTDVYAAALDSLAFVLMGILDKDYTLEVLGDKFKETDTQSTGDYNTSVPVGTGPFKFIERVNGESITMEANEKYWGGAPAIKKINFKIMTDTNAAVIALEAGEIDVLSHAPTSDKAAIQANNKLKWYEGSDSPGIAWLMFNNKDEIFSNKLVRQAVALAINKEDIAIGSTDGTGSPISSPIPVTATGYSGTVADYKQDISKAKELLAEAGYPNGFSTVMKTYSKQTYQKPTEILQAQLAAIGINVTIEMSESGTYWSDVYAHNYGVGMMNLLIYVQDADQALYPLYYTGLSRNFVQVSNPKLDSLLAQGRGETDIVKRTDIYKQVDQLFHDEVFVLPLFNFVTTLAANAELKGVEADPIYCWDIYKYQW